MVNYYEELDLDRSLNLSDLRRELAKKESLWKKRKNTSPEAAQKKLALIVDAWKAFETESTRADYDRKLDAGDESGGAAPDQDFVRWYEKARQYLDGGQYDLAVSSIERALSCSGAQSADADFYVLASEAYTMSGQPETGIRYANEAIILNPDNPWGYIRKAAALSMLAFVERQSGHYEKAAQYNKQKRDIQLQAASIAEANNMPEAQGTALGQYAHSLWFDSPTDPELAEVYARRAVALGDLWGNGQKVMDRIAESQAQEERERKAREKKAEEERLAREEAERLAKEKAEQEERERLAKEEEKRREQERGKIKCRASLIASIVLALLAIYNLSLHNYGMVFLFVVAALIAFIYFHLESNIYDEKLHDTVIIIEIIVWIMCGIFACSSLFIN